MTVLRDAVPSDLEALLGLDTTLFGGDAWTRSALQAELDGLGDNRAVVVAVSDGALRGYGISLMLGPVAELLRIGVAVEHSRAGIGSAILAELLGTAAAGGCAEMLLEVDARNGPARALYRGHGFEEISRRPGYYVDAGDAVVMRRGLVRRTGA